MNRIFSFLCGLAAFLMVLSACDSVNQEERAMQTAQKYYEQLFQGDVKSFVEGSLVGYDTVPSVYKSQLMINAKMYVERLQQEHQGVDSVKALRAQLDTIKIKGKGSEVETVIAQTFLCLQFADSTKEEIVVPMVLKDDIWYLR